MKTKIFKYAIIALFLTGWFSSCTTNKDEEGTIPFVTIANGQDGIFPKQEKIIKTQDEWEAFLKPLGNFVTDYFNETEIDFEKYQIIVVVDSRPTGGWNVYISSIKEYPYRIVVTVSVKTPTGYVTDGFTGPYHVVKMPVTEMPIEFSYLHL